MQAKGSKVCGPRQGKRAAAQADGAAAGVAGPAASLPTDALSLPSSCTTRPQFPVNKQHNAQYVPFKFWRQAGRLTSSLPVTCTCSCETMLPMAAMFSLKGRYRSCREGSGLRTGQWHGIPFAASTLALHPAPHRGGPFLCCRRQALKLAMQAWVPVLQAACLLAAPFWAPGGPAPPPPPRATAAPVGRHPGPAPRAPG